MYGWAAAAAGSVAQLINHLAAPQVPSADLLTTQNYLDALCGAVVLAAFALTIGSAFGLAALYRIRLNGTHHIWESSPTANPLSDTSQRSRITAKTQRADLPTPPYHHGHERAAGMEGRQW
ncbi:hypothetical protein ACRS5S_05780 [Nocardia asiatica]|uniref:hypothetical protein n=1 Tax=Nocardia asiatica TaxID=209252 RepID=UPI003EE086F3